jgi:hypothetical protein
MKFLKTNLKVFPAWLPVKMDKIQYPATILAAILETGSRIAFWMVGNESLSNSKQNL